MELKKKTNEWQGKTYTEYVIGKMDAEGVGMKVGESIIFTPVFAPKYKQLTKKADGAMFETVKITAVWDNIPEECKSYLTEYNNLTFALPGNLAQYFKEGEFVGRTFKVALRSFVGKDNKKGFAFDLFEVKNGVETLINEKPKFKKEGKPSPSQPLPNVTIPPEIKQFNEEISYTPEEKAVITKIKNLENFGAWDTYLKESVENIVAGFEAYGMKLNNERAKVVLDIYSSGRR